MTELSPDSYEFATYASNAADRSGQGSGLASDPLTEVLQREARRMLAQAVEEEAREWVEARSDQREENGHRQVVRNGYAKPRQVVTGLGPIEVQMPRAHDRRDQPEREKFESAILPPYLRKARSVEQLILWLYLKGVSTGDFNEALQALIGPDCPGLSASSVTRLKNEWEGQYKQWSERDLNESEYVYVWADGVHFNVRLEEDRQCILVLIGATAEGKKELIAVQDGHRGAETVSDTDLVS